MSFAMENLYSMLILLEQHHVNTAEGNFNQCDDELQNVKVAVIYLQILVFMLNETWHKNRLSHRH